MKNALVFISALSLVGCAAASKKSSREDFLVGSGPANAKAEEMESDLTRGSLNGGYYVVEVYPYTQPLVEAQSREASKRSLDTEPQAQKRLADAKKTFLSRTCFMFHVGTLTIESAEFKYWAATLEASQKTLQLTFENTRGISSVPTPDKFKGFRWSNYSVACAPEKLEASEFKVRFSSRLMSDAPVAELEWSKKSAGKQ